MLKWQLHYPDDLAWRAQPRYSAEVAAVLTQAYQCLRFGTSRVDAHRQAHALVHPISRSSMSLRQRLHVVYVLAMGHAACEEYILASGCLDEALELAVRLNDSEARIEILFLRGFVNRARLLLHEAAADFAESVILLECITQGKPDPHEKPMMLDSLTQLASLEFFLAAYNRSLAHLDWARRLVLNDPGYKRTEAEIFWITALHERQRGRLESALTHAARACSAYAESPSLAAFGRIQVVAADIALDICQRLPSEQEFDRYFKVATTYIDGGIAAVEGSEDYTGQGLALLAHARAARLSGQKGGRDVDRRGILDDVIGTAQQLDDSALLCQAYVGLGAELSASEDMGEREKGTDYYREAIHVAETSGVSSLATPARLALWHREELIGIDD
jgi:hypothetical protein